MNRRRGKNQTTRNKDIYIILLIAGCIVLTGQGSGQLERYDFCKVLDNMDENTGNYTQLKQELYRMCIMNLDREEEELGHYSVEFMEDLSVFSASWKGNETTAREYAARLDTDYLKIIEMNISSSNISSSNISSSNISSSNISSSNIPVLVSSLYGAKEHELVNELHIQDMEKTNITDSISQLEIKQSLLITRWEDLNTEAQYMLQIEHNVSRIHGQRTNESNLLTSNLNGMTAEYEQMKNRFKARILPYLFLGVVLGGIIGFALGLKWKKEMRYWHAYSSSAEVSSPLKYAAVLTGALLVTLVLCLYLSGTLS